MRYVAFLLAVLFSSLPASADPVDAGWAMGLACPPKGANGAGAMVASRAGGFSGSGSCARVAGKFSRLTFGTVTGGTLRAGTFYSLQTPSVLITPPVLDNEFQPIFSVATACPTVAGTADLNWIFVQWTDAERQALANTYFVGTATYSRTAGLLVTSQLDLNGSVYWAGPRPMRGTCTGGVYPVAAEGTEDLDGTVYFNAGGMGVFKTSAGRATFFFPRYTVVPIPDFGSKSYRGMTFDSTSAGGVADVRQVIATANGVGTEFTVQALSDPAALTVDVSGTAFTDTISITAFNSPSPGILTATVTRVGYGAGTGALGCIANKTDGDVLLVCSGRSPSDNSVPYNITLYAENPPTVVNGLGGGDVIAMARDSASGTLYLGGSFQTYGPASTPYLTALNDDGTQKLDFDVGTGFNDQVETLLYQGGKLYVGGWFTSYNGGAVNRLIRLNADGTKDTTFDVGTGFDASVHALVSDGTYLYAGGYFTTYRGVARNCVARLNLDGTLDTTFTIGGGFNGAVFALALGAGGSLYVGGAFTTFNGGGANRILRLTSTGARDTGFAIGTGYSTVGDRVEVLAYDTTAAKVYAGGLLASYNGSGGNSCITRIDTSGAKDTTFTTSLNGVVVAIALDTAAGHVYIAGAMTNINGWQYFAKVTSATGAADTSFDIGSGFSTYTHAIQLDTAASRLYVGGVFTVANARPYHHLVRLSTVDGLTDTTYRFGGGSFDSPVSATAHDAATGRTYLGGNFGSFDGTTVRRIARFAGNGALDTTFMTGNGFAGGAPGDVNAISVQSNGKILVGGGFLTFAGTSRPRIALVNADGSLDTDFVVGTGFNQPVYALAPAAGGLVYASGDFTTYGGVASHRLARLDATTGALDTTFVVGTFVGNARVLAYDALGNKLYVGGTFTSYGGVAANRILRLGPTGARDTSFNIGAGFDNPVQAFAYDSASGKLYVGGTFTSYDGTPCSRLVRLGADGTLDTTFAIGAGFDAGVRALQLDAGDGKLYVGGDFTTYDGDSAIRLVRLTTAGARDASLVTGSGFSGQVRTLKLVPSTGKLFVGGSFSLYAGMYVQNFVRLTYLGGID